MNRPIEEQAVSHSRRLPDLTEVFDQWLRRLPGTDRELLAALTQRWAGERYRRWGLMYPGARLSLEACAARAESVADSAAALHRGAAQVQRQLLDHNPAIKGIVDHLFGPLPIQQQVLLHCEVERLAARTWTSGGLVEADPRRQQLYASCAAAAQANAQALEAFSRDLA